MALPSRNPGEKESAIFEATLDLVAAHGFQGTTMSQIARKANIAVGTTYLYFPSKEDLISALYVEVKGRIARAAVTQPRPDEPVREGLKSIFGAVVRYAVEHPRELSFAAQCENSPFVNTASREAGLDLARPLLDLFERAREQGQLKPLSDEVLGAIVSGAVMSLARLHLAAGTRPSDAELDVELDAVCDAILA